MSLPSKPIDHTQAAAVRMMLDLGVPPAEVAQCLSDAQKRTPDVVYTDEFGHPLTEEQIEERLKAIHDEDYADWGGWDGGSTDGF